MSHNLPHHPTAAAISAAPVPQPRRGLRTVAGSLCSAAVLLALASCHDSASSTGPGGGGPISGTVSATFTPAKVAQGYEVRLDVVYSSRAGDGTVPMTVDYGGLVSGHQSANVPLAAGHVYTTFVVPAPLPDGTITALVTFPTWARSSQATVVVRDDVAPGVSAVAEQAAAPSTPLMMPGNTVFAAGTTVLLELAATDNNDLAWLGYELGAPFSVRDSVAVSGRAAYDTVALDVPASAAGSDVTFNAFTRDARGTLAQYGFGAVPVYRFGDRPTRTAPLDAPVRDVAIDATRQVAYLSQPSLSRVAVLSLSTMTFDAPIPMPVRPAGLDLTPSGDTLFVALSRSVFLGVVDLGAATTQAQLLRVTYPPDPTVVSPPLTDYAMIPWVEDVRVAANGRVIASLAGGSYLGPKIVDVDLAASAQRVIPITSPGNVPLVVSGDRRTVLLVNAGGGGNPPGLLRYDAAADAYTVPAGASPYVTLPMPGSTTTTGDAYLFGATLYDAELHGLRPFGFTGYVSDRTALGATGADVFVAAQYACGPYGKHDCPPETAPAAVLRYAAATARLAEMIPTPEEAQTLWALPDGQTLLALGPTTAMLIDLRDGAAGVGTRGGAALAAAPLRRQAWRATSSPSLRAMAGAAHPAAVGAPPVVHPIPFHPAPR